MNTDDNKLKSIGDLSKNCSLKSYVCYLFLSLSNICIYYEVLLTSKVELFVMIVNGLQPLTIITKSSTLDVAAVPDPPLVNVTCWKKCNYYVKAVSTIDCYFYTLHCSEREGESIANYPKINPKTVYTCIKLDSMKDK